MRRVVIRRVVVTIAVNCAIAAGVLVASSLLATPALVQAPTGGTDPPTTTRTRAEREAARVSALLERHDCWSDAAPAGAPEPQHAVVTPADGRPQVVDASVGFGIWLEGRPGTLHGFCP